MRALGAEGTALLGRFIREQRQLAHMSIREMARIADISNAYLSQVERGLHAPSLRVLDALAAALEMPVDKLVHLGRTSAQADHDLTAPSVERAIETDPRLTDAQRRALLEIYHSFVGEPVPQSSSTARPPA